MKTSMKRLGIVASLMLAVPLTANATHNVQESIQVADHYMFQPPGTDPTIAPGATILIRDFKAGIVTATVTSAALTPDYAYSIWWVVFNRPQFCAVPYECEVSDLGNDAIKPSVFWGGGLLADGSGYGNTQIELRRGRTDRELFANTKNYGLQNLKNAEIHLVLRTHDDIGVAGTVAMQIGTANEACPATGCRNVFFSVHSPQR